MPEIKNKKEVPEVLEVDIEKLSYQGYGIAKYNGYVIFVENACPGDRLRIRLGKKNKNFGFGKIVEIISQSEHRIKPFCPMQKVCGACQIQYIDYPSQLMFKKEMVEDCMRGLNVEIAEVVPSPATVGFRHKIQYPVSCTKNSKRLLAGYFKQGSHDIVNIKYCPIQPACADRIVDFIRSQAETFGVSGYDEASHRGILRHILIRSSKYSGKNLILLVINSDIVPDNIKQFAKKIYADLDGISGVGVNLNTGKTNLILGKTTMILEGEGYVEEMLCGRVFKIGPETFFQVNPGSADNIFRYVKKFISNEFNSPVILDAYAGITAFGICLADIAKKVISVEEVEASVKLAEKVVEENGLNNIELYNMDAGEFFERELNQNQRKYDVTLLDPPRKGCSEMSLEYALKLTRGKIIYVSCNPATLARDLRFLTDRGGKVEKLQPFDMFPHTYHIENVAIISVPKT